MATADTCLDQENAQDSPGNNPDIIEDQNQSSSHLASHKLLTNGFMKQTMPVIGSIQEKVTEVKKNQDVLIESLQRENEKFAESNILKEVEEFIAEVKYYRAKLVTVNKDMSQLSAKTRKLKQRAEKLTVIKHKEELKEEEKKRKFSDKKPGLAWGPTAKKYDKEKRIQQTKLKIKLKPKKVIEQEAREKGLKTKLGEDNKGFAMLRKMGYNPGDGLGKNKSGRSEPVPISIKVGKTGLGKDLHEKRKRELQDKYKNILMQKRKKYNEKLQDDFRARMSGKFVGQQFEKDLRKSQKVCHQLETENGIDSPEFDFFWPREVFPEDFDEEEDSSEEYSVEDKLFIITKHLRDTYSYCVWCAIKYNDKEDISMNCPGDTSKDHDD